VKFALGRTTGVHDTLQRRQRDVHVLCGHALRVCSERDQGIGNKINCERWSWFRMTIVSWAVLENVWTRNKLELKLRISATKF
jgi:hypothetical protein